ncbi:MAG: hypothetical protein Q7S21_03035 [archaeon]|nr:hypothetical protein [archaeon]
MPKFVKRANPLKHLSTYVPERGDEYGGVVGRIEIDKKMQTALYDRFKNGDKSAEELLVKQFLKYVFSIAKNEARKRGIFD